MQALTAETSDSTILLWQKNQAIKGLSLNRINGCRGTFNTLPCHLNKVLNMFEFHERIVSVTQMLLKYDGPL